MIFITSPYRFFGKMIKSVSLAKCIQNVSRTYLELLVMLACTSAAEAGCQVVFGPTMCRHWPSHLCVLSQRTQGAAALI